MTLLKAGRVDAVVENELVFAEEMEVASLSESEVASLVLGRKDMGVYFGHQFLAEFPEFLARFNAEVPACSLLGVEQ